MTATPNHATADEGNILSTLALLVSGVNLYYLCGPCWPLAYIYGLFGFHMLPQRAAAYRRRGDKRRPVLCFGLIYFISLAMIFAGLLVIERVFHERVLPMGYWPAMALVGSAFVWTAAALSEFGVRWLMTTMAAPLIGPQSFAGDAEAVPASLATTGDSTPSSEQLQNSGNGSHSASPTLPWHDPRSVCFYLIVLVIAWHWWDCQIDGTPY